jgi:hypothetical protein
MASRKHVGCSTNKTSNKEETHSANFASLIGSAKYNFYVAQQVGVSQNGVGIVGEAVLRNLNGCQKAAEPQSKKTCMSVLHWGIPETDDI